MPIHFLIFKDMTHAIIERSTKYKASSI